MRELAAGGTTVLLTMHCLDEADQLADRMAVVDGGRTVVEDTPAALKRTIGGDRLELTLHDADDLPAAAALLGRVARAETHVETGELRVHAPVADRVEGLAALARAVATTELRSPRMDISTIGVRNEARTS